MIHIEGRLQNNNYEDQNGVMHYSNVVIGDNVSFCGDKQRDAAPSSPPNAPAAQMAAQPPKQQNQIDLGDLGDFEEILSDGEVPF